MVARVCKHGLQQESVECLLCTQMLNLVACFSKQIWILNPCIQVLHPVSLVERLLSSTNSSSSRDFTSLGSDGTKSLH